MGCKESKVIEGSVFNKNVNKRRKAFIGVQFGKNPDNGGLGIEANAQMAYNFYKDIKFERVNGNDVPTNDELENPSEK